MKLSILSAVVMGTLALGASGAMAASNNANANAPGQNRTCLVTTGTPNSFNDADIIGTKWLPRKAAEAQASKNPTTMKSFDYANDPLVTSGKYKSAEDLCNNHFK